MIRIAAVGVAVAVAAGVAGSAYTRARLGTNDASALVRAQDELDGRFDQAARTLAAHAHRVASAHRLMVAARRDTAAARTLFQTLDDELAGGDRSSAGISVFDPSGSPLAWSGRVSDLPSERIQGPSAIFAAIDALGPRLVRVEPVMDPDQATHPRIATIVVEQLVDANAAVSPALADSFLLPTAIADVSLRASPGGSGNGSPYAFPIRTSDGQILAEAEVSASSLAATRQHWRAGIRALVFGTLALTLLFCAAPILEWRRHVRNARRVVAGTLLLIALMIGARLLIWAAGAPFIGASWLEPLALMPTGLLLAGIVWLALDLFERQRVTRRRAPAPTLVSRRLVAPLAAAVVASILATVLIWIYLRALQTMAGRSSLDLLHFSLHPFEAPRLSLAFGLLLGHASLVWLAAALFALPGHLWRWPRTAKPRSILGAAVACGILVAIATLQRWLPGIPLGPGLFVIAAALLAATLLRSRRGPLRRASQAARLGSLFLALLLPALALYPALHVFATGAKEQLISGTFAPQAASQREDLQLERLPHALEAIDAMTGLSDLVTGSSEDAAPTTDRAFIVWSQTELATYWTTSGIELYGVNGRLVSRFALIPEYGNTRVVVGNCSGWELYEETSPFGSTARNILRATRAICEDGRRVGAIVVRAMLDYRALPFISQQSPYIESLGATRPSASESKSGQDIEFAVYGWSRAPIYASGTTVWPLPDEAFDRMVTSRERFWTSIRRDDEMFRVYFFNDRGAIYALGYPEVSWLGYLVDLGELAFLAAVLYLLVLVGSTVYNALTSQTPSSGRALLREVRSSFYRKLFIAFVASAVVPVVVLAIGVRTYFANQFQAGIEESAVKTATVAQRLVEDYATLQQRGAGALDLIDDQFMVLVRRAIDQDVNLFSRERLQATSERPLFASHLLPSRTPGTVYRSIVLDRLPTSVEIEDVGGVPYLLAAAPVRTGGRAGIVTVPQPLRGQDVERQRDELDRRIVSVSVLFVLLGAALGYWMAERIADPVNRLTRATRQIARGDLDARIAATSSDELRRLVEDFNQMADDLKRQRADLERTQRLEAWADMARQVAHDIKNPLTPIQLSAEHVRRVNADKGRPLSPVLDECVGAILSQVALLRQISAEFSSFASSPTPRPEPTDVVALIEEVVLPYRTALTGRVPIEVAAAPGVPEVAIDRTLFSRALTNVIENALHAMPGGGALKIDARPDEDMRPRQFVVVEVSDTGIGMEADALARIFEPYFSTKATGTGLGLTIAKRNTELNRGTIAVSSERGVGTRVTMRLPIA